LHHLIQLYNLLVARVSEVNSAELLISMKNNHIQTLSHDFEFQGEFKAFKSFILSTPVKYEGTLLL